MKVISPRPLTFIHECQGCHAILTYDFNDIYQGKYIYCPICKTKQLSKCDLTYDGVVKTNDSKS